MCHFITAKNKARMGWNEKQEPANVSQIWGLVSPPSGKAANKVGSATQCWEMMGLETRCWEKGAAAHHISHVCRQRKVCREQGGSSSPGHPLCPLAEPLGLGSATPLKIWSNSAPDGMNTVSERVQTLLLTAQLLNRSGFQVFHNEEQTQGYKCIFLTQD